MPSMTPPFNPNRLFRQMHTKTFNPPYTKIGFSSHDDPDQLRKRAHEAISGGEPEAFVAWIKDQVNDWKTSDLCLHLVGQALKVAGQAEEAKEHLSQALTLRREKGQPLQIASTLLGLSEVARFMDDNETAWAHLNEAVSVYPHYRSAHLNRLCLASLAKDAEKLEKLLAAMDIHYPNWPQDEALCKGLHNDGELTFLRESALWPAILGKIQRGEAILCH